MNDKGMMNTNKQSVIITTWCSPVKTFVSYRKTTIFAWARNQLKMEMNFITFVCVLFGFNQCVLIFHFPVPLILDSCPYSILFRMLTR